jgi:hypothetical protein
MDWAERYTTPLGKVFTRGHKLALEHKVELALLKALGTLGKIPVEAYDEVKEACESETRRHQSAIPPKSRDAPAAGIAAPRTWATGCVEHRLGDVSPACTMLLPVPPLG